MKKHLPLIFTVLIPFYLNAQAPQVTTTIPANQALAVQIDVSLQIEFDQPLNLATADYSTFKIFGRWSGPMPFAFSFSNNNQTVELIPEDAFIAGEWVTVTISKGLEGENGQNMENGYSIGFWTATAPGSLVQSFIEELPLREPGEGLIQCYGAYAGDLDNDGYSDLTVINENSDDLRILLNDGMGGYSDWTLYEMGTAKPSPNEGADFNSDGEIDLVVTTAHEDEVRILMGNGDGTFGPMETYYAGNAARGVGVIDLDGDGNDDLAVTNRNDNNMTLLMNDGTGLFDATTTDLDLDGSGETSIAITDANNDGIPDAFVGYYTSSEVALYLGDGDGNLSLSDKISVPGRPWMIGAGDLDGDGNADVVSANSEGNTTIVSFGDGQGGLSAYTDYPVTGVQFPLAIDLGDLDGDGDLDMVTSNYSSSNFVVFENDGSGSFSVASILGAPNLASCAILHDRDNDGDLDITGTDEGDDVLLFFENGVTSSSKTANVSSMLIWPNPFSADLFLSYQLMVSSDVSVSVYNMLGEKMTTLFQGEQMPGNHQIHWATNTVPSGMYLVEILLGDEVVSQKVVKR